MKALHAADIHLDSPLRGLAVYEDAPVAELRSATRRALDNLIETAISEHVDLILLAGDVFDGDWAHYATGAYFVRQMLKLKEAGIPVVTIAGNHDAESKLSKSLRLPDNVITLSAKQPQTKVYEELGVAVHGQSYGTPVVLHDMCATYPTPTPGLINVGLLHTSVDGRIGHEGYAPCTVQAMLDRGYDYMGLGHVHTREVLSEAPPIVFPGVLQGRGLRETGPKGATIVEFSDGAVHHEHRVLDVVRWEVLTVDATDAEDLDDVCAMVTAVIRTAVDQVDERLLAAQLRITGPSAAHGALVANPERTRQEMILAASDAAGSQVWLQAAQVQTTPQTAVATAGGDAVGELMTELDEILAGDGAVDELSKSLESLADVLPVSVLEHFNPKDPALVRDLLLEVRRTLPSALIEEVG